MHFLNRNILVFSFFFFFVGGLCGQPFQFAQVTDTHVGGQTGLEDLRRTVEDLNNQEGIDFVILSGDITEFGSDEELLIAKQVLDSIRLPWYVIPGNHDSNWSESGADSFRKVFGGETFFFEHKGYQFMGTTSGPNMRMSPGQIPRENLVWMDSVFAAHPDKETPLIFINHYPLDTSLNNWFDATDRLLERNTQLALCGHGHVNRTYNWDGIQGVMGRSNLRAKEKVGGYNIVTIDNGKASFRVRYPLSHTDEPWFETTLSAPEKADLIRPDYSVNAKNTHVEEIWTFEDKSDMGAGMARYRNSIIAVNTQGEIYSLDIKDGEKIWSYSTKGKIYSTPAVWKDKIIVGSSDHNIYCLDARSGDLIWKYVANKAVLGSPLVMKGNAYIGGSDGVFRALDIADGSVVWEFEQVENFVSGKPTFYKGNIIFGSWGNGFYALNHKNGELSWSWDNGHANRMFSAAACYPVGVNNRVFAVAPDRYMTALDALDGSVIWRESRDSIRVRESMGVSTDGKMVYVKTMDGNVYGMSTRSDFMDVIWESDLQLPYELTPSNISTSGKQVLIPSHSGLLSSLDKTTGRVLWQYKISNAMINPILVFDKKTIVASTMDGKIVRLDYR